MNVLHVGPLAGGVEIPFDKEFLNPKNLNREITVDNPSDVWGEPIYQGPAWNAPLVLSPGTYHYVYTDEEDWDI